MSVSVYFKLAVSLSEKNVLLYSRTIFSESCCQSILILVCVSKIRKNFFTDCKPIYFQRTDFSEIYYSVLCDQSLSSQFNIF